MNISVQNVTKRYADHLALDSICLEVPEQSIYGLLGPNGAGKTTLIRILNQITAPDSGEVLINGERLAQKHIATIGYLPEERAWMDKFLAAGYTDVFRHFCSEPGQYSWWSYRFHAREKNVGWRIDYTNVNNRLMERVESCRICGDVLGSDHCPVEIVLKC